MCSIDDGKVLVVCPCKECQGTGMLEMARYTYTSVDDRPCFACDGTGVVEYDEVYDSLEDAFVDYPEATKIVWSIEA